MKRCFCLALIIAGTLAANGEAAFASPFAPVLGENLAANNVVLADDNAERRQRDPKDRKRAPKGLGARFWGGPYWGYGPRWGHPCRQCRSTCESGKDSSECRRCRLRCGW